MILPYYQIPFSVIIFQKLQVQKINQKTNYLQHSNIYLSTPNTGNYSSSNINSSTASISSFLPSLNFFIKTFLQFQHKLSRKTFCETLEPGKSSLLLSISCRSYQRSNIAPHLLHCTGSTHISCFIPNESQTDIKLFHNLQQIFQNTIDFIYQAPQKLQPLTK